MRALKPAAAALGLATVIAIQLVPGCGEAPEQLQPQTWIEAQALATSLGKPVLLDFFTEW